MKFGEKEEQVAKYIKYIKYTMVVLELRQYEPAEISALRQEVHIVHRVTVYRRTNGSIRIETQR